MPFQFIQNRNHLAGTIDQDFNLYSLNITVDLPLADGGGTCAELVEPTTDYLGLAFLETDNPDHGGQAVLTLQIDNGANITTQILLR